MDNLSPENTNLIFEEAQKAGVSPNDWLSSTLQRAIALPVTAPVEKPLSVEPVGKTKEKPKAIYVIAGIGLAIAAGAATLISGTNPTTGAVAAVVSAFSLCNFLAFLADVVFKYKPSWLNNVRGLLSLTNVVLALYVALHSVGLI